MTWQNILDYSVLGNNIENWIQFLAVFIISAGLAYIAYFLIVRILNGLTKKTEENILTFFVEALVNIKHSIVLIFSFYLAVQFLYLSVSTGSVIDKIILIFLTIRIATFLQRFFSDKFQKVIISSLNHLNKNLKKRIKPILGKVISAVIWVVAFFLIITNLGYDVTSLVAGLGVGGIFIGLAAQETLSNLFSSLSLFLDQPFNVGDIIKVNGVYGTVEDLGMRSTRIRTFEKTLVVIPNNIIAKDKIDNVSKRNGRRVDIKIGLIYSTSTAKLKEALRIIKSILKSDENVLSAYRVHFISFGDSALEIEVMYFADLMDTFKKSLDVEERVNLEIKSEFEKAGLEFAYPTQTLFVEKTGETKL